MTTVPTPAERRLRARAAAHTSWANTDNRSARTHNARAALEARFLREANGDPVRAESVRKAYYLNLAAKSAAARRRASSAVELVERLGLAEHLDTDAA